MHVFSDVLQQFNQMGFLGSGLLLLVFNQSLAWLRSVPGKLWDLFLYRHSYTCEIRDDEAIYHWVCKWLDGREFLFNGVRGSIVTSRGVAEDAVITLTPILGTYYFWHKRHLFSVRRSRRELEQANYSGKSETQTVYFRVYFGARAHVESLLEAARAASAVKRDQITVYRAYQNGWDSTLSVARRSFTSVFLPRELQDAVVGDARWFFEAEAWYRSRGIPHRRGYLIYGEPGTGKSSAIRALCSELNLNLGIIPARAIDMSEHAMVYRLASIPKPAIILFEDIDRVFEGDGADDSGRDEATPAGAPKAPAVVSFAEPASARLSGFLNALDGVASAEGYIVVMTANRPEVLDPALCRPGRIDRKFYVGYAQAEPAARFFRHFYGDRADDAQAARFGELVGECGDVVMAYLQELLMENRDDPAAAVARMQRHVDSRDPAADRPGTLRVNELGAVAA